MIPKEFWTKAYLSGCRITHDGKRFVFQRVDPPMVRWQKYGKFGAFGDLKEIDPPDWVVEYLNVSAKELLAWAMSDMAAIPAAQRAKVADKAKVYNRFFWHILFNEHELSRISHHAALSDLRIGGDVCSDGYIPRLLGLVLPDKDGKMPIIRPSKYTKSACLSDIEEMRF